MIITITNSGLPNGRPTQIGGVGITVESGASHIFTIANFTTDTSPQYSDPEDDPLKYIKITSVLSNDGQLQLNSVDVVLGQLIYAGDISSGNLIYTANVANTNSYDSIFKFDIADAGSSSLSGLSTGKVEIRVSKKANLPPSAVGDNQLTTPHATTITFTKAHFTTQTIPAYSDPEGDLADKLKITFLPAFGLLKFNGINVTVNQVITFDQIAAGYFQYVPDSLITTLVSPIFGFSIADAGSGQFVS